MSLNIPLAHDFSCRWCYVATFQTQRLRREFDVEFEWLSYETWPADLPRPVEPPARPMPNRPPVPSRFDLMLALEHVEMPQVDRPMNINTHLPLLAAEFAKSKGRGEPFILEVYRAYWDRGEFIGEIELLCNLGEPLGLDPDEMRASVEAGKFADRIVPFDASAYKTGIFNLPTFTVGGQRYAQQPYPVLSKAVAEATKEDR